MLFQPSEILKPYIKSYSVITIEQELTNEVFYPSGYMDLAVYISGNAATIIDGHHRNMPNMELLGQLTVPTRLSASKGTCVLLARIFPHAGPLFLSTPASEFTNDAVDLNGVLDKSAYHFYEEFINAETIEEKVKAFDSFLIQKLKRNQTAHDKVKLIASISKLINEQFETFTIKRVADHAGFSERYIQRVFLEGVGLTPRTYFNIQRFNKTVQLVQSSQLPFGTIAHECGYYDQAHFIKEFRKYTGITPSEARPSLTEGGPKFQQAVNIGL